MWTSTCAHTLHKHVPAQVHMDTSGTTMYVQVHTCAHVTQHMLKNTRVQTVHQHVCAQTYRCRHSINMYVRKHVCTHCINTYVQKHVCTLHKHVPAHVLHKHVCAAAHVFTCYPNIHVQKHACTHDAHPRARPGSPERTRGPGRRLPGAACCGVSWHVMACRLTRDLDGSLLEGADDGAVLPPQQGAAPALGHLLF